MERSSASVEDDYLLDVATEDAGFKGVGAAEDAGIVVMASVDEGF